MPDDVEVNVVFVVRLSLGKDDRLAVIPVPMVQPVPEYSDAFCSAFLRLFRSQSCSRKSAASFGTDTCWLL